MASLFRTIVSIGYLSAVAILAVNAVLVYVSLRTITNSYGRIGASRTVIIELEQLTSLLRDAETGQRGYLLTERENYLEPYNAAKSKVAPSLQKLRDRMSADSESKVQIPLLDEFDSLAAEKMRELGQTIQLGRDQRFKAAIEVVLSNHGKNLMDRAKVVAAQIEDMEKNLLNRRLGETQSAVFRTGCTFVATTLAGLILLLAVVGFDRRAGAARRKAEEAIRIEQTWLSTTLSSIGDALIATDGAGRIRLLNPIAEKLTGWTLQECIGMPMEAIFRIVNEETRQPVDNPVTKVIREGRIVGLANHTVLIARDGAETPIDDSAAPIRGHQGGIIGVVMVFRDVTERKAHEEELLYNERRLQLALEATKLGTWDVDLETKTTYWSDRSKTIFGVPTDIIVTQDTYRACIHPDDSEWVQRTARMALDPASGGQINIEYRIVGPHDGVERWVASRGQVLFDETGKPVRHLGTILDISESKRIQHEMMVAKEEADEANEAKNRFLAVLSHELRTPLNPILLGVSSMLERPSSPDEIRANLEMIRQNVNLQARLIDDLLDVMRIVRGKMPLHWEVADCHVLIHQAVQICRSEILGKELKIELDLTASHRFINADPARLQQVFWNLIKNSVKFTPLGGMISFRTRNVTEPSLDREHLIIEVRDNGFGIDPTVLPMIFDPFQQGETTITRKFGGLGLGLAICKGVIEGHGGTLVAESQGRHKGATFRIELAAMPEPRLSESKTNGQSSHEPARPAISSLKILVVEDEQATRRLMARLLKGLGHEIQTAGTITVAMEIAMAQKIDLIISDIGLPDGSGLELMRQIVADRGSIPAIALTGYGMEDDIQRSRSAGFTAHMTKPIDFTKLEVMIQQVMSGARIPHDYQV